MRRRCIAEILGTFILVFAGTGSMVVNDATSGKLGHMGICAVWGLTVVAISYALGDVSGAHCNPSVTVGFWLAGRFPGREVGAYVASQIIGAILASGLLRLLMGPHPTMGGTHPLGSDLQAFGLEIVATWMLIFVVLQVATGSKETGVLAGIAVGGLVALISLFDGPITGSSMNLARTLGPGLVSGNLGGLWVYVTAPLIGSALAVGTWKLIKE